MTRGRRRRTHDYTTVEPGLSEANRVYIRYDRNKNHWKTILVFAIVRQIITAMKQVSLNVFAKLKPKIFGDGSSFEGLKVGEDGDFDIDVLLRLPEETKPRLRDHRKAGYTNIQLQDIESLTRTEPELYTAITKYLDHNNYFLASGLKSMMQSVFDTAMVTSFSDGIIRVGMKKIKVVKVSRNRGPASKLAIRGGGLHLEIDLVPGFLLTKDHWPGGDCRPNPYPKPDKFFIVPKQPKGEDTDSFRLSFQMQERAIIHDRFWMKPTIRIFKLIRNKFGHKVSSYAIKALFIRELFRENPDLDDLTPDLWSGSFSYCLLHCLTERRISDFWIEGLNLLDNLSDEQKNSCRRDIEGMLEDIRANPDPETILYYLRVEPVA